MTFAAFNSVWDVMCLLLPPPMCTRPAKAMIHAIATQESRLAHRRQLGGPARGFWMFEHGGGVRGVLTHPASRSHIRSVLDALCYDYAPETSYHAIEHNDVLACAYARLLLWTLPEALPGEGEADEGWNQYMAAWRAGKPHRETWNAFFDQGWAIANED